MITILDLKSTMSNMTRLINLRQDIVQLLLLKRIEIHNSNKILLLEDLLDCNRTQLDTQQKSIRLPPHNQPSRMTLGSPRIISLINPGPTQPNAWHRTDFFFSIHFGNT